MTGSLIQIISKGPQDNFLTGNPQISYFKSIHKKHTNFASQLIENKSNENINKSNFNNLSYDIVKYGDLIHKVYVRIKTFIKHTLLTTTIFKLQSLNHINIIKVHEVVVGTTTDKIYIVMDYVPVELGTLMLSMGNEPFSLSDAKCLLKQLLNAVSFLHLERLSSVFAVTIASAPASKYERAML